MRFHKITHFICNPIFTRSPKNSTGLQEYSPHRRASFYFEFMEIGMLKMMIGQCERIHDKIKSSDQHFVEAHIDKLNQQIRQTKEQAKLHREQAMQKDFAAVSHH